jgi:hypothetical protein
VEEKGIELMQNKQLLYRLCFIVLLGVIFIPHHLQAQVNQESETFMVEEALTSAQAQQIDSLLSNEEDVIDVKVGSNNKNFEVTYQSSLKKLRILDSFNRYGYTAYFKDENGNKVKVGPDGTLHKVD